MPVHILKAPISIIMIEKTKGGAKHPYLTKDTRHNRTFWPLFTDRKLAVRFMAQCPTEVQKRLHLVVVTQISDLYLRFSPFVEFYKTYSAAQGQAPWVALDHPGPQTPNPKVLHVLANNLFRALSGAGNVRIITGSEDASP